MLQAGLLFKLDQLVRKFVYEDILLSVGFSVDVVEVHHDEDVA